MVATVTAESCVGVWRGCWTGNPTLHSLCMMPRSVKGGNDGGKPPTSGPTPITLLGRPSNGGETKKGGGGKGGKFSCRDNDSKLRQLVGNDKGTFCDSKDACA